MFLKKAIACLLVLVVLLTMVGCGQKEEETTTAPATEATTPALTTPEPTTPEATTPEASSQAPKGDSAQAILDAATAHWEALARSLGNEAEAARQLSLQGEGSMKLHIRAGGEEQTMEIPVGVSVRIEGVLDSLKGAHILTEYEMDLGLLGSLLASDEEAENQQRTETYYDFASMKTYTSFDNESWFCEDLAEITQPLDRLPFFSGVKLEDIFESYEFDTLGNQYIIEGKMKRQLSEEQMTLLPDEAGLADTLLSLLQDLSLKARLRFDEQMRFTGMKLEADAFDLDLSSVTEGFSASMEKLTLQWEIAYDTGSYELPQEVGEAD